MPNKDPAAKKEYMCQWRERNRDKQRAYGKKSYHKLKASIRDRQRWYQLYTKYGITQEEYETMLKRQHGKCAVCNRPPRNNGIRLAVDHCHSTGVIRGLLCNSCNPLVERMEKYISTFGNDARYIHEMEQM